MSTFDACGRHYLILDMTMADGQGERCAQKRWWRERSQRETRVMTAHRKGEGRQHQTRQHKMRQCYHGDGCVQLQDFGVQATSCRRSIVDFVGSLFVKQT